MVLNAELFIISLTIMKVLLRRVFIVVAVLCCTWSVTMVALGFLGRISIGGMTWYYFPLSITSGVDLVTYDGDFVCICLTGLPASTMDVWNNRIIFSIDTDDIGYPNRCDGCYGYKPETREIEDPIWDCIDDDDDHGAPPQLQLAGADRSRLHLRLGASGDEFYEPLYRYFVKKMEALPRHEKE